MTSKERVMAALLHKPVDRVPRGELGIEAGFIQNFLWKDEYASLSNMAKELKVRQKLHMDLINIHEFPKIFRGYGEDGFPIYQSAFGDIYKETPHSFQMLKPAIEDIDDAHNYNTADLSVATAHTLTYYRNYSNLFLMAQIHGPVSALDWMLGMENYLCYCMTDADKVAILAKKVIEFEAGRAKLFLNKGAQAILIADDIAFNTGLLLPPDVMEVVAYPFYKQLIKEIKSYRDVPVLLHSDGYLYDVIPNIIECGFDGLHSLQPTAQMDIYKIKQEFGKDLCLMGNVDLNYLLTFGNPQKVKEEVCKLAEEVGKHSGFILSTCNIITDSVKPENIWAMYNFDM